jgi:hypothetical protein
MRGIGRYRLSTNIVFGCNAANGFCVRQFEKLNARLVGGCGTGHPQT